ncbi:MAG: prepilin peptidase [Geminicoccaceae bacterium]
MAMLPVVPGIAVAAAGWMLLAMAVIDLDRPVLPDSLTLPLLVLGLLLALAMPILAKDWPGPGIGQAVAGAVVGGGGLWLVREVYWRLRGREGWGWGMSSSWRLPELAARPLTQVLLTAALAGLAFALRRGLALRSTAAVPFGPSWRWPSG